MLLCGDVQLTSAVSRVQTTGLLPSTRSCWVVVSLADFRSCYRVFFFCLFLVSKLSWLVRNVRLHASRFNDQDAPGKRRPRGGDGIGPSPRYVVGGKEVRRFFCDGEHDRWVLYLSSTWRNRHQIPWNLVVVSRRRWTLRGSRSQMSN